MLNSLFHLQVQDWSYLDAIYFLFTSISTVGYGDLLPQGEVFLLLSSLYVLLGLALLAKVIGDIRRTAFSVMVDTEHAIIRKLEKAGMKAKSGITKSARRMFFWRNRAVAPEEMTPQDDDNMLAPPVEMQGESVPASPPSNPMG